MKENRISIDIWKMLFKLNPIGKEELEEYTIIATSRGHKLLFFEKYGSYQGDWIMVSRFGDIIYFWHDYYGSCSGCDALEAREFYIDRYGNNERLNYDVIYEFVFSYEPFVDISLENCKKFCREEKLSEILPANVSSEWSSKRREETYLKVSKIILSESQ